MKLCMVTPHLPPDQAANALLPALLGDELVRRGHEVGYIAFEPKDSSVARRAGILYLRRPPNGWARAARLSQLATLVELIVKARGTLRQADIVHVHSNTFMNQVAAWLAHQAGRPFLLTHYGTEIWHYRKRALVDPFRWMNAHAAHVTYYSRRLLERSLEMGLAPSRRSVVYPPVHERFRIADAEGRHAFREALGLGERRVLINVKRLHPLAGQRYLVESMTEVRRDFPEALLLIAGEGEERRALQERIDALGLGDAVRLLGMVDNRDLPRYYAAADLFVLPSLLEAFPTVAAEALASGLKVVSADHPGGRELKELFPDDVELVPRQDADALSRAIGSALRRGERVSGATLERIEAEFRPQAAVERYLSLYQVALGDGVNQVSPPSGASRA